MCVDGDQQRPPFCLLCSVLPAVITLLLSVGSFLQWKLAVRLQVGLPLGSCTWPHCCIHLGPSDLHALQENPIAPYPDLWSFSIEQRTLGASQPAISPGLPFGVR